MECNVKLLSKFYYKSRLIAYNNYILIHSWTRLTIDRLYLFIYDNLFKIILIDTYIY